ncbi:hypothetical protein MKW98_021392 [Papaver atlanticum]|uniref:Protein CHUP1, chloroplastic n=1 Tax=Papaver atlanticum TaxID=357466 RepID=A0AAD4XIR9_9MAGN|nr:hypothetical protein MKW98_021392 [Papaver atlanticum]
MKNIVSTTYNMPLEKMANSVWMMITEEYDHNEIAAASLLYKLGVALAISAVGFLYVHLMRKTRLSRYSSSCTPFSDESYKIGINQGTSLSLQEPAADSTEISQNANDLLEEFVLLKDFNPNTGVSPRKELEEQGSETKDGSENGILELTNMLKDLREKEKHIEIQLLEHYGLKGKENAVMDIHNQLKLNSVESKVFGLKIESLLADKRRLEEQVADRLKVVAELESAKATIKLLNWKIKSDVEHKQEEILSLNELPKDNSTYENYDMLKKLETKQPKGYVTLSASEADALRITNSRLRKENGELVKEIDHLQKKQSEDAKEHVYYKWVNACLRYELRNHQAPRGKFLARDLSKTLSPRSEGKAKQLILEYANSEMATGQSMTSMDFQSESNIPELGQVDEFSSFDNNYSAAQMKKSRRAKLFRKIKNIVLYKGSDHTDGTSSLGSTTTSSVPPRRRQSIFAGDRGSNCSPMSGAHAPNIPRPTLPSRLTGPGRRSYKER